MNKLEEFINEQREIHGLVKLNESKFEISDLVYNTETNTVGIVRMEEEKGEVKTDADGNVNVDNLVKYDAKKHKKAKIAPSTQKEIDEKGLNESEDLNEGSMSYKSSSVIDNMIKLLDDAVKGFAGKNGLNDPKHTEGSAINKELRIALKSVKAAKKLLKSKSEEIYLRNTTSIKEDLELELDLEDAFGINEKELSPLQKEYQEYFKDLLAEYEVSSPAKLSPEKKIEFFNSIKSGWVVGKGKKDK